MNISVKTFLGGGGDEGGRKKNMDLFFIWITNQMLKGIIIIKIGKKR